MSNQRPPEEDAKKLTPREQRLRALQQQLEQNRETPPNLIPRPSGIQLSFTPSSSSPTTDRRREGMQAQEQEVSNQSSLYQVIEVRIEDILESPYQTREAVNPEKYQRLVQSMKEEKPQDFKDALPVRPHPSITGKWQVVRGGHTRLMAARTVGLTTYPVVVVHYDNKRSALGTARENLARDDLSPIEEGRLYLLLREEFGYSQESLSSELGISRDRMKECEAAAKSAPDILAMFQQLKTQGADASRGLRAAKYLRRLDTLDKADTEQITHLRAPLISAFLGEQITTDGLDLMTKRLLEANDPQAVLAAFIKDLSQEGREITELEPAEKPPKSKRSELVPEIQRSEKLNLVTRRFRQFSRLIGQHVPTQEERQVLVSLQEEIEQLLQR